MRASRLFAFSVLVTFVAAAAPAPALAPAAAPSTRPTVPALVVGATPPKSFVVDGIYRWSAAAAGVAFHVATDGERQLCIVYDAADGTPLFLSDGQQTLVYDLANSRVARIDVSRCYVRVDWDATSERPLGFGFAVEAKPKLEQLDAANAWFRVDRFVAAAAPTLRSLRVKENVEWFAAERRDGIVESVQIDRLDASWFRFTSGKGGEDYYGLEMHATGIGEKPNDAALAFPDPARLPADIHLTEVDIQTLPGFLAMLRDGRAYMAKLALAAGPDVRELAEKIMPKPDWDELRKRDATYGAAYRTALAEQGFRLRTYPQPATTKPSR